MRYATNAIAEHHVLSFVQSGVLTDFLSRLLSLCQFWCHVWLCQSCCFSVSFHDAAKLCTRKVCCLLRQVQHVYVFMCSSGSHPEHSAKCHPRTKPSKCDPKQHASEGYGPELHHWHIHPMPRKRQIISSVIKVSKRTITSDDELHHTGAGLGNGTTLWRQT